MTRKLRSGPPAAAHFRSSDLRAASQLATQATTGVVDIVEEVHHAVLRTLGLATEADGGRTRGVTGLVYRSVRGAAGLLGTGAQRLLTTLEPLLPATDSGSESLPRLAVQSALNGVLGDQLEASGNPLAIRMALRCGDDWLDLQQPLSLPATSGKILLVIHGLCMNDRQWTPAPGPEQSDHAAVLARERGYLPVFLRYNSGRAIAGNGADLATLLDTLISRWPVPVTELCVLAHSMGGLLIRSAIAQAPQSSRVHGVLGSIIFLGTPHHGAPLERAGNWADVLLGSTRWSAPFARLGQLRSAGITDLRYGHVVDRHADHAERFVRRPDTRQPLALPVGVACRTIAATTAASRDTLADRLLGDGLVPLASALGDHPDPQRALDFAADSKRILYRTGHLRLLHDPQVTRQLLDWLD